MCPTLLLHSPEEEEKNRVKRENLKRPHEIEEMMAAKGLSKKKVKKRLRNPNKNFDKKQKVEYKICYNENCNNPRVNTCICYTSQNYGLINWCVENDWLFPKWQILDSSKQSIFSFSHNVYKRLVLQSCKNQGLFGKW